MDSINGKWLTIDELAIYSSDNWKSREDLVSLVGLMGKLV